MADLNGTRVVLENAFNTGWAGATDILYANANYEELTQGDSFILVTITFTISENVCIGAALTDHQRHWGTFNGHIHIPLNEGIGAGYNYADTFKGIMDNKVLSDNVMTLTSNIVTTGESTSGYFGILCSTQFYSDEF